MQLKDEHLIGIIGVLVIHMGLLMFLVFKRVDNTPAKNHTVPVEYWVEEWEEMDEESAEEDAAESESSEPTEPPKESFADRLEREGFEQDPVNLDQEMRDRLAETAQEAAAADAAQALKEAAIAESYEEVRPKVIPRQNFSGTSIIGFYLKGRTGHIKNPVYLCENGGEVEVDIWVDSNGNVIKAKVNSSKSQVQDDCLYEEAERASLASYFNSDPTADDPQHGTIQFRFLKDR